MSRGHKIVLLLVLLLLPTRALARDTGVEQAKKHFKAGKRHFDEKDYREALREFTLAYQSWSNRIFHYNIALCHAFLNQTVQAARHLRLFLQGATSAERELPEILKRVQSQVGLLRIRTPDPQAAIFIGGRLVGHGRVERVVAPGSHKVEIRREGQTVLQKTLTVEEGEEAGWSMRKLPRPRRREIPRQRRKIHVAWFSSMTVLAAVAFGTALGLYFKTDQINKDYLESGEPSLRDKGKRYQDATNALLGVSAGVLVTAGILAIFTRWRRQKKERPLAVTVAPPDHGRGVVLGIAWER